MQQTIATSQPIPQCNNTSVGVIVWHPSYNFVLLQERAKLPIGIAAPAGHVDPGESFREAARRELFEETGLVANTLRLAFEQRLDFACRRPGGTYHDWHVYKTIATGPLTPRLDEVRSLGWYSRASIKKLAERTAAYKRGEIAYRDWEQQPGLEPVWCAIFEALGLLSKDS